MKIVKISIAAVFIAYIIEFYNEPQDIFHLLFVNRKQLKYSNY